jgi:transcriptional regulator GlxA family with amidase domain
MTVPLDRVLPWRLPEAFMGRLLRGDLMVDPGPGDVADEPLFARWVRDLESGDAALAQIVGLEVEARLRRFAAAQAAGRARGTDRLDPAAASPRGFDAEHKAIFAQVAARIEAACVEDLPIAALLEGAGVSADYAGRIFKACCGMSPLEYRTQLRIAHAQRLLIEGKASITDVALASGFGSLGRFYAAFRRICGETPRGYRKGLG